MIYKKMQFCSILILQTDALGNYIKLRTEIKSESLEWMVC